MKLFSTFRGLLASCSLLALGITQALAFNNSRQDNVAVYWGQNSYGAAHSSDPPNWQKVISEYCQDDAIDALPIAFLNVFFSTGGMPEINLANTCGGNYFPGTSLSNCQFLAPNIKTCQAKGKIVTLSLGGASGSTTFTDDSQAQQFADTIWNLFLGGTSSIRPFGDVILDGVDLDIESGSGTGLAAFVTRLRTHISGAAKMYYVTAAPQCVHPDAHLQSALDAVAFDAVYVQFYNNYCGLNNYPDQFNFGTWDTWAKTKSPNKDVKVYIGAPASATAAGSGYVDAKTLINIALDTRSKYSSFGGVMLWDASQAVANDRYDLAIKNGIRQAGRGGPGGSKPAPPGGIQCAHVPSWKPDVAYRGGDKVIYKGHLWIAKWWSQASIPGGIVGDWLDLGPCIRAAVPELEFQRYYGVQEDMY
ncbi:carbohydrate-binding module family 5 protein [Macrolepiota fuliginosa MF-IS2]|uniref:chitinase n=1 Tax=Macrolepiota fuliginosa MF-IS2 TaxID=1400762 RepID=A0A9P5X319_9AGAR|nr:carbohydrate-binding module family 5 protein [Macrolepiota fuliginosa MF-IS2]